MTKKIKKDVDGGKVQNKRFPDILLLLYSVGFDNFIKKKAKKAQIYLQIKAHKCHYYQEHLKVYIN